MQPLHIVAQLDAALSEINKIPCSEYPRGETVISCLKVQREQAGRAITPFQEYDPSKMCNSCAAYWHASRAMTLLMKNT